jgi:hypothetical protein
MFLECRREPVIPVSDPAGSQEWRLREKSCGCGKLSTWINCAATSMDQYVRLPRKELSSRVTGRSLDTRETTDSVVCRHMVFRYYLRSGRGSQLPRDLTISSQSASSCKWETSRRHSRGSLRSGLSLNGPNRRDGAHRLQGWSPLIGTWYSGFTRTFFPGSPIGGGCLVWRKDHTTRVTGHESCELFLSFFFISFSSLLTSLSSSSFI